MYLLITKYGVHSTVFTQLGAAKGLRTRYYKGKGLIYQLHLSANGLVPELTLVDSGKLGEK